MNSLDGNSRSGTILRGLLIDESTLKVASFSTQSGGRSLPRRPTTQFDPEIRLYTFALTIRASERSISIIDAFTNIFFWEAIDWSNLMNVD
jgi:hypothetical protein